MIKFFKSHDPDNPHDRTDVLLQIDNQASIDDMVEMFEEFLLASGYIFRGHFELVEDE
jgi:hypothetical protein